MIKIFAFDLVGVLVSEKDINLTPEEDKIERLFGPNKNDDEFLIQATKIIPEDIGAMETAKRIVENLYEVKNPDLFFKLKMRYPNIKIIIVTNHISHIRKYIEKAFDKVTLDEIYISAEMNKIKPNSDFYEELIIKNKCKPEEILFLDDNGDNIDGARKSGFNVIKVEKTMNLYDEIVKWIENKNDANF